jgi:hypothetical protein
MLKNLAKGSLQRVSLSRGVSPIGTRQQLIERLSANKGPFGINNDSSQEEKVLSLIGISDYQLSRYLGVNIEPREELLSKLFDEELSEESLRILSLSQTPLKGLYTLAGTSLLPKAGLIRVITGMQETPSEFIERTQEQLEALDFKIVDPPEPIEPKPLTKTPFTPAGTRKLISDGVDTRKIPVSTLRSVVGDYILFPRKLKDSEVQRIVFNAISEPVNPMWPAIKNLLSTKKISDVEELVRYWGYENLTQEETEFLFSRGYLRNVVRAGALSIEEASERLLNLLDSRYKGDDLITSLLV